MVRAPSAHIIMLIALDSSINEIPVNCCFHQSCTFTLRDFHIFNIGLDAVKMFYIPTYKSKSISITEYEFTKCGQS